MKKLVSLLAVVAMLAALCSMSVSAYGPFDVGGSEGIKADEFSGGTASQDVVIAVTGEKVSKYAVDITFGTMKFTYSTGSTWNPTTHKYDVGASGSWSGDGAITIDNHSDLPIHYTVTPNVTDSTHGSLQITADKGNPGPVEIAACAIDGTAPTDTVTISVSGTPNEAELSNITLGTVKVDIAAVAP